MLKTTMTMLKNRVVMLKNKILRNKSEPQEQPELDLKVCPPHAGETRTFPLGQTLFFSPKPLPTVKVEPGWGKSAEVLTVNDTYMDIGMSNHGKAFQVQVGQFNLTLAVLVLFVGGGAFFAYATQIRLQTEGQFWYFFIETLKDSGFIIGSILFFGVIVWSVIIQTSLQKARQRPIRLHRQRREICYYPEGSNTPVIAPWEEVIAWVALHRGTTGVGMVSNVTFGFALPTEDGKEYWILRKPMPIVLSAQMSWEVMRCYMEEPPEYWAMPEEEPESRKTFDNRRRQLRQDFKNGPKKWFTLHPLMAPSVSYASMFFYYLFHIMSLWKLPYLVAEWDHQFSMKKRSSYADEWSQSLPEEEWAKPSKALLKQKAAIEAHFAKGGTIEDFIASEEYKQASE